MKRSLVGWVAAFVLAIGGAAFAYVFWFAGGSGEPTTELTTPQLSNTTQPTEALSTTFPTPATVGETKSRDMFEIGISSVPNVADVTNEVVIALEFVAVAG